MTSSLEQLMEIWPNFTGMIPVWSTIKVVQTVPVGCISRSRGQKNRFSKCNFQKSSCPKLQGPELSYLVYSIIQRSSTNIWWTTLVVLCKWLHSDLWPFPQVSDPGPSGPSCLCLPLLSHETYWGTCTYALSLSINSFCVPIRAFVSPHNIRVLWVRHQ